MDRFGRGPAEWSKFSNRFTIGGPGPKTRITGTTTGTGAWTILHCKFSLLGCVVKIWIMIEGIATTRLNIKISLAF